VAGSDSGLDPEFGERRHQHGLDPLDEPADAGDSRFELEHRVADELARTMKRDVSPTLDAMERNATACKLGLAHEQIRRPSRPAKRDDRFVFEQHQRVGSLVLNA